MAERCPGCQRFSLILNDLNATAGVANHFNAKSGFYEYRCQAAPCSLAFMPGLTYVRCWQCAEWVPGNRRDGALICCSCVDAGADYEVYDLRKVDIKERK